MTIDPTTLNDNELNALGRAIWLEQKRRATEAQAPALVARIQREFLDARDGNTQPDDRTQPSDWPDWQQPAGAHDAYPAGYTVHLDGRLWRSSRADNAPASHQPGTEHGVEWTDVTVELLPDLAPEPDDWPAWEPWDHVRPLYQIEAQVTHNGRRWIATVGNNHWEPGVYGWNPVTD